MKRTPISGGLGTWAGEFRSRCQQVRKAARISQRQLAKKVGLVGPNAVSLFENGRTEGIRLSLFAAYLGMADDLEISRAWVAGLSNESQATASPRPAPLSK